MILINRQVNNHYSMGGTHFLQTGYLLLNRNAPFLYILTEESVKSHYSIIATALTHAAPISFNLIGKQQNLNP